MRTVIPIPPFGMRTQLLFARLAGLSVRLATPDPLGKIGHAVLHLGMAWIYWLAYCHDFHEILADAWRIYTAFGLLSCVELALTLLGYGDAHFQSNGHVADLGSDGRGYYPEPGHPDHVGNLAPGNSPYEGGGEATVRPDAVAVAHHTPLAAIEADWPISTTP